MIEHSTSIVAISSALLTFQGAVDGVERDRTNPHFKSRYATLEAVRDTAVPELQKVGIVYMQSPGAVVDGNMSFTTLLVHAESGEWMKFTGDIPLGKKDPQGAGSAITYMSRYSLMAALGLPAVDDDGNDAMPEKKQAQQPVKQQEASTERFGKADSRQTYADLQNMLDTAKSLPDLKERWETSQTIIKTLPADWEKELTKRKDTCKADLTMKAQGLKPIKAPSFDALEPNDLDPIEQLVGRHE